MSTVAIGSATVVKATFNGNTAHGPISVPGLAAGDALVRCIPDGFIQGFEPVVSSMNQILQEDDLDWSGVTFTAYFLRGA